MKNVSAYSNSEKHVHWCSKFASLGFLLIPIFCAALLNRSENTEMPSLTIFFLDRCRHSARLLFSPKQDALCLLLHLCVRPGTQADFLIDPCLVGMNGCRVCGLFVTRIRSSKSFRTVVTSQASVCSDMATLHCAKHSGTGKNRTT